MAATIDHRSTLSLPPHFPALKHGTIHLFILPLLITSMGVR